MGTSGEFDCMSFGDTRWYIKSTSMEPISNSSKLVIENVDAKDAGLYYCYGLYDQSFKHFIAKANLRILGELIFVGTFGYYYDYTEYR